MTLCTPKTSTLIQDFEQTINTNLKLATKEIWVVSSQTPSRSLKVQCIVRQITTAPSYQDADMQRQRAKTVLALAKRDFRKIVIDINLEHLWWMTKHTLCSTLRTLFWPSS